MAAAKREFDAEQAHFAEVAAEFARRTVDSPRVPQADIDQKGALYWGLREEHPLAGTVLDLCRFENAYFFWHGDFPDLSQGEPTDQERAELEWLMAVRTRCADPETGQSHPAGPPEYRWGLVGSDGRVSGSHTMEKAQEEWAERQVQKLARYEDTVPEGARPSGFRGFEIEYSSVSAPVDEVQVLAHTLAVRDGMLRGLVRNRSRTLWAYGTVVEAEGRRWRWPLSIQPGEVAPFELEGWDGGADPGRVEFEVTAEMSNDMDLSRYATFYDLLQYLDEGLEYWEAGIPGEDYDAVIPPQVSERLDPRSAEILDVAFSDGALRLLDNYGGSGRAWPGPAPPGTPAFVVLPQQGISHPGSGGYWQLDPAYPRQVWVAWISAEDRTVLDVAPAPLFSTGTPRRHGLGRPFLSDRHYHPEHGYLALRTAFDHRAAGTQDTPQAWIAWAGGAHPATASP